MVYCRATPHNAGLTGEPPPRQTGENYFARSAEDAGGTDTAVMAKPRVTRLPIPPNGHRPQTANRHAHQAAKICQLILSSQNDLTIASPRQGPIG